VLSRNQLLALGVALDNQRDTGEPAIHRGQASLSTVNTLVKRGWATLDRAEGIVLDPDWTATLTEEGLETARSLSDPDL
jgi:hypothetical protein